MLRRAPLVLLVAAACSGRTQSDAAVRMRTVASPSVSVPRAAAVTPPPALRLPHDVPPAGAIRAVVIDDRADAALTLDEGGGVRLWPAFDGRRAPIALPANAPAALALARDGDDALIAAILDQAGGVSLWRVDRDGALRGRAELPDAGAYVQVVAIDGGVLAVRRDQSIERYDARGARRGRIAVDAGERIARVAVRRGRAIALVSTGGASGETSLAHAAVRWIALGDGLAWGARVALPGPVRADELALAPALDRIAVFSTGAPAGLEILELAPAAHVVLRPPLAGLPPATPLGFPDDATLAAAGVLRATWHVPDGKGLAPEAIDGRAAGDVGDGLVVTATRTALVLTEAATLRARYLGWQALARPGALVPLAGGVALVEHPADGQAETVHWLDAQLAETRRFAGPAGAELMPVDDRHVLVHAVPPAVLERVGEHRTRDAQPQLALHDAASGTSTSLAIGAADELWYRADVGLVAARGGDELRRYRLDVARGRLDALPALAVRGMETAFLLDPARADGAAAFVTLTATDVQGEVSGLSYLDERPGAAPRTPPVTGLLIAYDPAGDVAALDGTSLVELRPGRVLARFTVDDTVDLGALSHADRLLALRGGCIVSLRDARGAERWRRALCGANALAFTSDDRELVVSTSGGVVALDPATGDVRAAACGWGFGLSDAPPPDGTLAGEPVCAGAGAG